MVTINNKNKTDDRGKYLNMPVSSYSPVYMGFFFIFSDERDSLFSGTGFHSFFFKNVVNKTKVSR